MTIRTERYQIIRTDSRAENQYLVIDSRHGRLICACDGYYGRDNAELICSCLNKYDAPLAALYDISNTNLKDYL